VSPAKVRNAYQAAVIDRIEAAVSARLDGFVMHGFQHEFHPPHSGPS
jgi:hypothetical protein